MKVGDLVRLHEWCRFPNELGTIIETRGYQKPDPENIRKIQNMFISAKVLVKNEVVTLLPQDFEIIK
jgi:hypothetical protein